MTIADLIRAIADMPAWVAGVLVLADLVFYWVVWRGGVRRRHREIIAALNANAAARPPR